jgi:hypothetical protein
MTLYARVEDGVVAELVDIEPGSTPLQFRYHPDVLAKFVPVQQQFATLVRPGWRWEGQSFTPPPPVQPVAPREVTNFQARALLMSRPGPPPFATMFHAIDAALRAEGGLAWQAWEYANVITLDGQLVSVMAERFGMGPAELEKLFIEAVRIEA